MVTCPRCGHRVNELHPIPPEVMTKDLIGGLGRDEPGRELETCRECIRVLMDTA